MEELWDDYLQALLWIGGLEELGSGVVRVCEILHDMPFVWELERDENRAIDGMKLRNRYDIPLEYAEFEEEFYDADCSVLEMLLGLSIRVDDYIIGNPKEPHPEEFFLTMIQNLGLVRGRDLHIACQDRTVRQRVKNWLHRWFSPDGKGSPFPLRRARLDQREVEIWDQMNAYVSENYR